MMTVFSVVAYLIAGLIIARILLNDQSPMYVRTFLLGVVLWPVLIVLFVIEQLSPGAKS